MLVRRKHVYCVFAEMEHAFAQSFLRTDAKSNNIILVSDVIDTLVGPDATEDARRAASAFLSANNAP